MLEDNVAVLGLQPAVGRLANALVAVLGPELTLGSPAYCSCRALIREMQVTSSDIEPLQEMFLKLQHHAITLSSQGHSRDK